MMLHRKTKEEKIENSLDLLYTYIPTVFNIGPKHLLFEWQISTNKQIF